MAKYNEEALAKHYGAVQSQQKATTDPEEAGRPAKVTPGMVRCNAGGRALTREELSEAAGRVAESIQQEDYSFIQEFYKRFQERVGEALERWSPKLLRFIFLQAHYSSLLEVNDGVAAAAEATLKRVASLYRTVAQEGPPGETFEGFYQFLLEDLNTPEAFAFLFRQLREHPELVTRGDLRAVDELLGGVFTWEAEVAPAEVVALAEARAEKRAAKQWAESDALREELRGLGWQVEDLPGGFRLISWA